MGQQPGCCFPYILRVHIAHHAQHHIVWPVEGPVAAVQHLRSNVSDGLPGTQNRDPHRVCAVHNLHQVFKHPAFRAVGNHIDLLADDALLLFHTLVGKVRDGHEFQQQLQILLELLCSGEIIGGHIIAGKGVWIGAQGRKLSRDLAPGQIEHLVLQEMGHTVGGFHSFPVQTEPGVDRAVVRDEIGKLLLKTRFGHYRNGQPVGKGVPKDSLIQLGVILLFHSVTPLRKYTVCSFSSPAAWATCCTVTCSTAAI